ncbi:hypothetical protein [Streptosporangium oxazolinicum]
MTGSRWTEADAPEPVRSDSAARDAAAQARSRAGSERPTGTVYEL